MPESYREVSTVNNEVREKQASRRYARANVDLEARYLRESKSAEMQGRIRNLGGGGLRLVNQEDIGREETMTIRFTLPAQDREIVLRGKVVLSFYDAGEGRFAHGVAFTQVVPADQTAIMQFVSSIEHENADIPGSV